MRKALISAFMLVATAVPLHGQTAPDELNRRIIERRAFEAVVWGMPAVNYDLMLQEMLSKTPAKVNQVVYWGKPLDWHNQTLTPNPDTLYFMAFFNTSCKETPAAQSMSGSVRRRPQARTPTGCRPIRHGNSN